MSSSPSRFRISPSVALLLLWLLIIAVYFDTARGIVAIWLRSDTFAHGFLVVPISAWLVWRRREELGAIEAKPAPWVLLPLLGCAIAWLIGDLAASNSVTQFAFASMIVLAVPTVMGVERTGAILFPLGFLFFAVPFGDFLMPQLMMWTANFTVAALQVSGVPVFREGLQFLIPSGSWSVVEACSGVRYLIASVMVGTLFAYLNYRTLGRRLAFVAVSIIVPILANWLRAYMIVMLGHLSDNKLAAGVDHLIYGWVFFGVVIALMFAVGAKWAQEFPDDAAGNSRVSPPAHGNLQLLGASTLAGAAVLLLLPHVVIWNIERLESAAGKPDLRLPSSLASGWAEQSIAPSWIPAFQNASTVINRQYALGQDKVSMYVGYYRQQGYGRKLVDSENMLVRYKDPVWAQVMSGTHQAALGAELITVSTARLRNNSLPDLAEGGRLLAWQVYWINGTLTSSDAWARLAGAVYKLMGRGDDAAVIVLSTPDKGDEGALSRLSAFATANHSLVDAQLRATRDRPVDVADRGVVLDRPKL